MCAGASTSNIEILEGFQSKALRMTVDAPRYVPNTVIRRDQKEMCCNRYKQLSGLLLLFAVV
jgi:hypothetical protein